MASTGRHYRVAMAASERDLMGAVYIYDAWFQSSETGWRLPHYYRRFRPYFFVMRTGDKVVGYCVYRPSCVGPQHARKAVLYAIALDPAVRGLGLGDALLSTTLDWLATAGVREVGLFVEIENNEAVRLYEKVGFSMQAHFVTLGTLWMSSRLATRSASPDAAHESHPVSDRIGRGQ